MVTQLNSASSEIKSIAHQIGRLNGPSYEIEKPLHARIKVELDSFYLKSKGRYESIKNQLSILKERLQDLRHMQVLKQQLRAELPVSKAWTITLMLIVMVGLIGEAIFIQSTVADGLDMDPEHGYPVAIAILVALLPIEFFLGKWFLSKSNISNLHQRYPKKSMIVAGVFALISGLAMYAAIGLFRAQVFSWGDGYAFDSFIADSPLLAYFIVAAITTGMFIGLPFAMAIVDSNWKVLMLSKELKQLSISEDFLTKQHQDLQAEFVSLQTLLEQWETIKENILQAWLVDAHVAYMEGVKAYLTEQEKAELSQIQQDNELAGSTIHQTLSELTQRLLAHEINQQVVDAQKKRALSQLGYGLQPINYMNGYNKTQHTQTPKQ